MIANLPNLMLAFISSAIISYIIARLLIVVAKKYNILDLPKVSRKIHDRPIPLLGGVAIYGAWALVVLFLQFSNQLLDVRMAWSMIVWFLLAGLILIINGVLDDKYNLKPQISIWGPIIASIIVIYGGLSITHVTNPTGGVFYLDTLFVSWLPVIITFLWLMGITYTTKLLDGVDGLTPGIGLIASLVIFVISLSWDVVGSTTSLLSLTLAGAIAGFLILNWHPAKIFLGEGGSTFIGFSLGVLAIISGSKIATALLVMGLPLLDIFWVVIKRLRKKQAFWKGDNEHLHFRLLKAGLNQRQVVIFMSLVALAFGLVSIFFTTKAKIGALLLLLVFMFLLSSWLNYKLNEKT